MEWLSCINEYLAIDSCGNEYTSRRSRVGVGMKRSAREVKKCKRSNGPDIALYKTTFTFIFTFIFSHFYVGSMCLMRRIHLDLSCASSPDNSLSDESFLMLSNHLRFCLHLLLIPSTLHLFPGTIHLRNISRKCDTHTPSALCNTCIAIMQTYIQKLA